MDVAEKPAASVSPLVTGTSTQHH